jgi:hypothetical protein
MNFQSASTHSTIESCRNIIESYKDIKEIRNGLDKLSSLDMETTRKLLEMMNELQDLLIENQNTRVTGIFFYYTIPRSVPLEEDMEKVITVTL